MRHYTRSHVQPLIAWLFGSVFFGALPWTANLIVQFAVGQLSFHTLFRIYDLMCFVITLSATTMLDLTLRRSPRRSQTSLFLWMSLVVFLVLAALLLGIASFDATSPPAHAPYTARLDRLIWLALVLSAVVLVTSIAAQIHLLLLAKAQRTVPEAKE